MNCLVIALYNIKKNHNDIFSNNDFLNGKFLLSKTDHSKIIYCHPFENSNTNVMYHLLQHIKKPLIQVALNSDSLFHPCGFYNFIDYFSGLKSLKSHFINSDTNEITPSIISKASEYFSINFNIYEIIDSGEIKFSSSLVKCKSVVDVILIKKEERYYFVKAILKEENYK